MINYYLLKVCLNTVTLYIFEQRISSRFRKYQVKVEYAVTGNKTEAFLHPLHLLRNKGDTANFDLEKPNFCQLLHSYFSFYLLGNLMPSNEICFIFLKGVIFRKIII